MPYAHGKNLGLLYGGHDLSAFTSEANPSSELGEADVTAGGAGGVRRHLVGLEDATLSAGGPWDGAPDAIDDVLNAALGALRPLTFGFVGFGAIGNRVRLMEPFATSYEVPTSVDDAVRWSAEFQASNGMDFGVVLADLAARTADGNGTAVDNAASSANGGVAHLHVTAYSSLTNVVVKVQHSSDGSTWADLVTFTTVSAAEAYERVVIAGTVNRYIRASWDVTGTGSFTAAVAFARR